MDVIDSGNSVVPPAWLRVFANEISTSFHATNDLAPIGCHFFHDRQIDVWEVTLFASKTQIVGGHQDGRAFSSNFHLDLAALVHIFDTIDVMQWQALAHDEDDDLGSHIAVEGTVNSNRVWLRVTAKAPAAFEHGRVADLMTEELRNLW